LKKSIFYNERFLLFCIVFFDLFVLLFCASGLSISYHEVEILATKSNLLTSLVQKSLLFFGKNDFSLRAVPLAFHVANVLLLYRVAKFYLKRKMDRLVCVLLYVSLPGVIASSLVINSAVIVVFLSLLLVYAFEVKNKFAFVAVLVASFFVGNEFAAVLFVATLLYGVTYSRKDMILAGLTSLIVWLFYSDFLLIGTKSYLLDAFAIFAISFSPFVFLWFIYSLYRIGVKEEKSFLWFINAVGFCSCIALSTKQRVDFDAFLPFCVSGVIICVWVFFNSYRIRLPQFRTHYKRLAIALLCFLWLNVGFIVFNGVLYRFVTVPQQHFLYKFHVAKELSSELKSRGIYAVNTEKKLASRLEFYGIKRGGRELFESEKGEIRIFYAGVLVASFAVR